MGVRDGAAVETERHERHEGHQPDHADGEARSGECVYLDADRDGRHLLATLADCRPRPHPPIRGADPQGSHVEYEAAGHRDILSGDVWASGGTLPQYRWCQGESRSMTHAPSSLR